MKKALVQKPSTSEYISGENLFINITKIKTVTFVYTLPIIPSTRVWTKYLQRQSDWELRPRDVGKKRVVNTVLPSIKFIINTLIK